ncbi:MAG: flagellar protein FlbB [Pseudorhodoplanes sp.]|nr:flagellar protein FlbB [Pseudorhodoplanes sp.]
MENATRLLRDVRIVPVVLVAIGALLVLKLAGLVTGNGYVLSGMQAERNGREVQISRPQPAANPQPAPRLSWAQEMFGYPDATGSVTAPKPAAAPDAGGAGKDAKAPDESKDKKEAVTPVEPKKVPDGTVIQLDPKPISAAERALLERLSERRKELEQRAREIEMREMLLQAAEQKLRAKTDEMKDIEARIVAATQKKEEMDQARLKGLVVMYENMKPRDAAKILEGMELKNVVEVAKLVNPRRMSEILSQMSPAAAQVLTAELMSRETPRTTGQAPAAASAPELPKIEGRPAPR